MEKQHSLLHRWLENRSRNIIWFITGLKRVTTAIILRTFRFITSLKGATIIVMVAMPFVIFAILEVPQESREIALLSSLCQAIALVVGVGIAIFLGVAQIHSPYHTPRTLLTRPTLALLSALLFGILLALAVLQGSHLTWLCREPLVIGPFCVSWVHITLIWFAESVVVLPLYLKYAVGRLGVSGLVNDASNHILQELRASKPQTPSIVELHVKTLGDIALTALGRKEYLTLERAFLSLGNLLWKADAAARDESQFKGRADVIFHGLSMQPLPPGQTDPWRVIYRELFFLHNLMLQSPELMIKECRYLRDIGTQAIEDGKASVTVLAMTLFIKQILDQAVAKNDAELTKLAPKELSYLASAAVKTALTDRSKAKVHREYFLTAANRAIKGIEDAFISEVEKPHLKETIPKTVVWDKEVLPFALSSIQEIAWTVGDVLTSTPESEDIPGEDELDQHWPEDVVSPAIGVLSTLGDVLEKAGRLSPARRTIYHIARLGLMVARLGWSNTTKVAIYAIKQHASEYLTHTGSEFKAALNSIDAIRRIGLTSALEAKDGMTALHASLALTSLAHTAINNNKINLALDIIGGKNSVVTIIGLCRHKSVVLTVDARQLIIDLATDLNIIATSPVVAQSQLQSKTQQALYELNQWSKQQAINTKT